jgi:hypothetical protein
VIKTNNRREQKMKKEILTAVFRFTALVMAGVIFGRAFGSDIGVGIVCIVWLVMPFLPARRRTNSKKR